MTNTDRLLAALDGRYRIERQLGQGGMATVYLAEDLKHKRQVAIKVLKPELAAVLGAERFVQEITTTASMSHPHILPLFDSGTADGFLFYVMPYIEGETLREKLNRETQLGVDESVHIIREIADALEYAHRRGVIHRDIKPENILMHDGRPMVADFGIALAVSAAAGGRMTETGLSLGTPHYMSPEQATAEKEISARSDIYSLASVLYEMLAGVPPHTGASAQQIIMKIVTEEAGSVTQLRRTVPDHVADAISKALEKLPADRFESAKAFGEALLNPSFSYGRSHMHTGEMRVPQGASGANRSRSRRGGSSRRDTRLLGIGALALMAIAVAGWALTTRGSAGGITERVEFSTRPPASFASRPFVSLSQDGLRLAMVVTDSVGIDHVVVRDLSSSEFHRVPGTDGAQDPSFSPDGKSIVFLSQGALRQVAVDGGPVNTLSPEATSVSEWARDGFVYFSLPNAGLSRVPEGGGKVEALTKVDTLGGEFGHWSPQLLPGGKTLLFTAFSTPIARSKVMALDLKSRKLTVLLEGGLAARYLEGGYLVFAGAGTINAVRFDPSSLKVSGAPVPIVENVAVSITEGVGGFFVAQNGTLTYLRAADWYQKSQVLTVDRTGAQIGTPIAADASWGEPRFSPDGRWIALSRLEGVTQIWLFDRARSVLSQLSRSVGVSFGSVWYPDSRALLIATETPSYDLARLAIDGSSVDTLFSSAVDEFPGSISPDGKLLTYTTAGSNDQTFIADIDGKNTRPVTTTSSDQRNAMFSPDGRWLLYEESTARGQMEIYVRSVAESGGRRQISADGGASPRWSKNGREIVFIRGDAMMAAPFDPAAGEPGTPVILFRRLMRGQVSGRRTIGYDVTPDGSRFVIVAPIERRDAQPLVVVLNFLNDLRAKVR